MTRRSPMHATLTVAAIVAALAASAWTALGCARSDAAGKAADMAAGTTADTTADTTAGTTTGTIAGATGEEGEESEHYGALYADEDGPLPNDKELPVINEIDDEGHFICPVKQIPIVDMLHARSAEHDGFYVYLACPGAKRRFVEDPEGFMTGKRLPMKRCGDGECEYRQELATEGKTPEGTPLEKSKDADADAAERGAKGAASED